MTPPQHPLPGEVDLAIIGAGAAGLAAAIFAGETNPRLRIALLDSAKHIGAKILVSGGGRCNVTNREVRATDFHGQRKIIDRILRRFDAQATIRWFTSLGVPLHEEISGKLFPDSHKARTVLDALLRRCEALNIMLYTNHRVLGIHREGGTFLIRHLQGCLRSGRVILATGGRSVPKTGSDGSGWTLAGEFGHTVTPTYPALVPLLLESSFFHADLSGTAHDAMLTTTVAGKTIDCRIGRLLWTHFGISGPVVLDASRCWVAAHEAKQDVRLALNCFPHQSWPEVNDWFTQGATLPGRKTVLSLLAERLPTRVAGCLIRQAMAVARTFTDHEAVASGRSFGEDTPLNRLSKASRHLLVRTMTQLHLPVVGPRGWNFAEVTAGGVPLAEISPNSMASRLVPGLYLIGEMLDCDGRIGGFNFQWAWSTGYLAGSHAARA